MSPWAMAVRGYCPRALTGHRAQLRSLSRSRTQSQRLRAFALPGAPLKHDLSARTVPSCSTEILMPMPSCGLAAMT